MWRAWIDEQEVAADREVWSSAQVPVRKIVADREAWSRAYVPMRN